MNDEMRESMLMPELEEECQACKGDSDTGKSMCHCDNGKVPTKFGEAVLEFIKRRLSLVVSARLDVRK